ncbi:MAG: hypothetical protein QM811_30200 [Pirellulales bacterium]
MTFGLGCIGLGGMRSTFPHRVVRAISTVAALVLLSTSAAHVLRADEPSALARAAGGKKPVVPLSANAVDRLISALGDEQFLVRERAQCDLEGQGSAIYERLLPALRHRDPEVGARAARIASTIRERISDELSVSGKRDELKAYFGANLEDRRNILAQITVGAGNTYVPMICRIVRFEQNEELSKAAALRILASAKSGPEDYALRGDEIRAVLNGANRAAAKWLLAYAETSESDPNAYLARLVEWFDAEHRTYLDRASAEQLDVTTAMLKTALAFASEHKRRDEAVMLFGKQIDLERPAADELPSYIEWIVKQQAWELLPALRTRFPAIAESRDPRVLYLLAESEVKQDKPQEADVYVARALESQKDNAGVHLQTALMLYQRGLHRWCERECRAAIDAPKQGQGIYGFRAMRLAAELCGDDERFGEAADLLEKASTLYRKNESVQEQADAEMRLNGDDDLAAKKHFYRGMQASKKGEVAAAQREFKQSLDRNANDADVLIAMYRLPDASPAQRKETLRRIQQTVEYFQNEINNNDANPQNFNQYAWLIANTEGDYDLALEYSRKSLELFAQLAKAGQRESTESAGLIDTLAHCYFAKKDYDNAVKSQLRAAELEPQSLAIKRNLLRFQKVKAEFDAEKASIEK